MYEYNGSVRSLLYANGVTSSLSDHLMRSNPRGSYKHFRRQPSSVMKSNLVVSDFQSVPHPNRKWVGATSFSRLERNSSVVTSWGSEHCSPIIRRKGEYAVDS